MARIARLYSDLATAEAALAELKMQGEDYGTEIITAPGAPPPEAASEAHAVPALATVAAAPADAVPETDPLVERMERLGVDRRHAERYAGHLHRGGALLVTEPLFSRGVVAAEILDGFHPVELDLPVVHYGYQPTEAERRAAPLSAQFGWRVLLDDPAPLSRRLGWRTLTSSQSMLTSPTAVRIKSRNPAPLSRAVGMRTLSAEPAPLSSKLKWRTLWGTAAPLSDKIGWRTLLGDPAPLSKRLGWRTLSHDPAPLSRSIGWRALSKDPAPLSRLLGWPTLTKRQ
jgi:hypothetical protein